MFSRSIVSDSVRPHGLHPIRLLCPGDSPDKSTAGGCHFLLQGIVPTQGLKLHLLLHLWQSSTLASMEGCVRAQSCPTLFNPMDCSPPVSSVHGESPGKNTGLDCHALLQGIFPT